ncbi:3'-5' exonuclease [Mycobacterium intracellulare]|uniref:3'-5' exonuclease n=1 Tax=Mycobacterium intracellulare TaxID=1767 RepID=A0AAE4UEM4_MYCIT|nr:3'-5' exonuclease [Mycobacterium intracellulare]MDV6979613.1 3'-5' exonuclease [Mycobacterium intracellulare]MDV6985116.1 3'-5' exonuclease [Mycobacterium intracellulare]MDV7014264.1 3'-5' exonuclease [Mycobacterium intracellulare]MDV7030106.1 3'-5' exonuclease [Mycobacterium intracellulare]
MSRELIVVDTETTGLHAGAAILEVAAINVTSGEEMHFVPHVTREKLGAAQPAAMQINRYYERGLWRHALNAGDTEDAYWQLSDMLSGNTFGGCNPAFDAQMLGGVLPETDWHHRLADLAAYAGPALLLAPNELVGLADICERLGVQNNGEHTALGDARATAECFRKLTHYYANRMEPVK